MNSTLQHLEKIVRETYNTEFRMGFDGKEWRIYIVKTTTRFYGTFDEVIQLAIEEFISYRVESNTPNKKNYKKYTYR